MEEAERFRWLQWLRWLATGLLCLASLAWGFGQIQRGAERAAYRQDLAMEDPQAFLLTELSPRTATRQYHVARADVLSRDGLQENCEMAVRECMQAIRLDPLHAMPWMLLSREYLHLGEAGKARAALEFSDTLNPRYPSGRLEAISLWYRLGDEDRAKALAVRIGDGLGYRREAAGQLIENGMHASEIFELLNGASLPPEEMLSFLRAIYPDQADEASRLFRLIPASALEDTEFRAAMAKLLTDPLIYEPLLTVWRSVDTDVQDFGGKASIASPYLHRNPFSEDFRFGWLLPREDTDIRCDWEEPDASHDGEVGGLLVVSLPHTFERRIRWPFYKLLTTGRESFDLAMTLRGFPPDEATIRMRAMGADGGEIASDEIVLNSHDWQELRVQIPALGQPAVIDMILERYPPARGARTVAGKILVRNFFADEAVETPVAVTEGETAPSEEAGAEAGISAREALLEAIRAKEIGAE